MPRRRRNAPCGTGLARPLDAPPRRDRVEVDLCVRSLRPFFQRVANSCPRTASRCRRTPLSDVPESTTIAAPPCRATRPPSRTAVHTAARESCPAFGVGDCPESDRCGDEGSVIARPTMRKCQPRGPDECRSERSTTRGDAIVGPSVISSIHDATPSHIGIRERSSPAMRADGTDLDQMNRNSRVKIRSACAAAARRPSRCRAGPSRSGARTRATPFRHTVAARRRAVRRRHLAPSMRGDESPAAPNGSRVT